VKKRLDKLVEVVGVFPFPSGDNPLYLDPGFGVLAEMAHKTE
jgi:hypothetical protein